MRDPLRTNYWNDFVSAGQGYHELKEQRQDALMSVNIKKYGLPAYTRKEWQKRHGLQEEKAFAQVDTDSGSKWRVAGAAALLIVVVGGIVWWMAS